MGGVEYEIESIPFFVYSIARSDIVQAIVADDQLRFERVIRRSGHRTLRVGIKRESNLDATHEALHALVSTSGLASEWHAIGYVAVDLPEPASEAGLLPTLQELAANGRIEFEIDGWAVPRISGPEI